MKQTVEEFKKFIMKGNVLDLAVAVMIGGAFNKIVTSLVADIFTPLIGLLLGGINFSGLEIKVEDAVIKYGFFIQSVIDFLITALVIFFLLKAITKITTMAVKRGKKDQEEETKSDKPVEPTELELLKDIRDLLKKQNK
jgi:large conductance mechanosensitive channel